MLNWFKWLAVPGRPGQMKALRDAAYGYQPLPGMKMPPPPMPRVKPARVEWSDCN